MSFRLPSGTPDSAAPPGWPGLPTRLAHIAELAWTAAPCGRFADVGCDHGRLARALARRGGTVTALDRAPGALQAARATLEGEPRAEARASDGFDALEPGAVEVAVLAGMGARQILRILDRGAARTPPQLVLQPQSEFPALRRGLRARGWAAAAELAIAERGRGYFVGRWVRGSGEDRAADPHGLGCAELDAWPVYGLWLDDLHRRLTAAGEGEALRGAVEARRGRDG